MIPPTLPEDRVTLEYLKHTLGIFFREKASQTKTLRSGRHNTESRINEFIYELEGHLSALKKQYDINLSLNADITSDSIRQSFQQDYPQFFRATDYQYNFLLFLACNHEPEKEIRQYIGEFLDLIRNHLTWADLVVTETDVTRAKTNLRFTVNELRQRYFLPRPHTHGHALLPTLYGLLVLYTIRHFSHPWTLRHPLSPEGIDFRHVPSFNSAVASLSNPDFFRQVIALAVDEGLPASTAQHLLNALQAAEQTTSFNMNVFLIELGANEPVSYRLPFCEMLKTMPLV
ncbi:hypothetical protein [Spirosoma pomorum]